MGKRGRIPDPNRDEHQKDRQRKRTERDKTRDLALGADESFTLVPKNKRRRARCRKNAALWAKTYLPDRFYLPLSRVHLDVFARIQKRILHGGKEALALERGGGKDTLVKAAVMWAVSEGFLKYPVLVAGKQDDADKMVEDIRENFEQSDLLFDDYPEICIPARALEGSPARARSQKVNGERTLIKWGKNEIRLPRVKMPDGKYSASSGTIIMSRGIESKIRGLNRSGVRPDFYFVTDPEDDESVESETITKSIERRIDKALGGLSGPGKKISAAMACTLLKRGCLADKYTDPAQKPAWNGHRYKAVEQMPDRMDLWQTYTEMRHAGMVSKEDPDGRKAHSFYLSNRKEMDAGAIVAWDHNFICEELPDGSYQEVSAIQHYMNILCDMGQSYFATEIQNDPLPEEEEIDALKAEGVAGRLSKIPMGFVPQGYTKLVRFFDIGAREIHYVVAAGKDDCTLSVIDYRYISTNARDVSLQNVKGVEKDALERQVLNTLKAIRQETIDRPYTNEDGEIVPIDLNLVDDGYLPDTVIKFVGESGPRWRAVKGCGTAQRQSRYHEPKPGQTQRLVGWHYYAAAIGGSWRWIIDTDYWKHFTVERMSQDTTTPGAMTLFGADPKQHKAFAQHQVAEKWNPEKGKWEQDKRRNHFWDCHVGCHLALGMLGARIITDLTPRKPQTAKERRRKSVANFRTPDGRPYLITERR